MTAMSLDGWTHQYSGKVRDLYVSNDDPNVVLVVASDVISAYDHILTTPIPDKGKILTALSLWWFEQLDNAKLTVGRTPIRHHLISTDVPDQVAGRAMICRRLTMVPVECVVRGYLTGSGWAEYQQAQQVCGVQLPDGLQDGSQLADPIFTPARKAAIGDHDENVSYDAVAAALGEPLAAHLRDTSIRVYSWATDVARAGGVLLADTKFEFGHDPNNGDILLGDEVLTPDSSRFWPADHWTPGQIQPSFDKQFVRDWLTSPSSGWSKSDDVPPPPLPPEVVERTRDRYLEAYKRITGRSLDF